MPTESGNNCQYAFCLSCKSVLLIGESLKYIIVFTDIIFYFVLKRPTNIRAMVILAKTTLFIATTPST